MACVSEEADNLCSSPSLQSESVLTHPDDSTMSHQSSLQSESAAATELLSSSGTNARLPDIGLIVHSLNGMCCTALLVGVPS